MITMAQAFNEWMRRYTEEPDRFEREFQTVAAYVADVANGHEPSYGESCAAYLEAIMEERSMWEPRPTPPATS